MRPSKINRKYFLLLVYSSILLFVFYFFFSWRKPSWVNRIEKRDDTIISDGSKDPYPTYPEPEDVTPTDTENIKGISVSISPTYGPSNTPGPSSTGTEISSTPVPATSTPVINPSSTSVPTNAPAPTSTSVPTSTPRPIASGKVEFSVSSSETSGPIFSSGYLDPIDPSLGQQQTVRVNVSGRSGNDVTAVTIDMITDSGTQNIPLSLISGNQQSGTYQVTWNMNDSYNDSYMVGFRASDATGDSNVVMSIR